MTGLLVLTIGLPGSGKSCWADAWGDRCDDVIIIERDRIRELLTGNRRNHTQETAVTGWARMGVDTALRNNGIAIVSDTNLKPRYRREWADMAAEYCADYVEVSFLGLPVETCIERDAARPDPVGEEVIRGMHQYLLDSGQIKQ